VNHAGGELNKMTKIITSDKKPTRGQRLWQRLVDDRRTAPASIERAKLVTASWKTTEGLPVPIRRAKSFEKVVNELPIYIEEDQLIAGDMGSWPMAAELICDQFSTDWILERLEDQKGYLVVKEEDMPALKEIAQFWRNRCTEALYFQKIGSEATEWLHKIDIRGAFVCGPNHLNQGWNIPDYPKVISQGLNGIKSEIEKELAATVVLDEVSLGKKNFLEALLIVIKAGISYAGRYSALAGQMAKTARGKRKTELEEIARVCEWVPANPARTFREAVQALWFMHVLIYFDAPTSGVSPGRVDQYLYPYYKKDLEEGRTTREEVIELLELLRCKFSSYRIFAEKVMTETGSGEAEWFNCVLGGVTADGRDATNEMSYLWLEAAKKVGSPHPTLSLRVHENMDEDVVIMAAEVCRMGRGYPAWFGDRTNIAYLLNQGIPLTEARNYAIAGCTLAAVPGKMSGARVFFGNIPKMLELTLNNGVDPVTGELLGLKTGKFADFKTYDDLWKAFINQVRHWLRWAAVIHNDSEVFNSTTVPCLVSSLIYDDCIKRGLPSNGGGCRYQQGMWYLLPTGPVDVADSLSAIKKCVYEDKSITKKQLLEALALNFTGNEFQNIRKLLLAAPKYGNDDDYVDYITRDIYTMLDRELSQIEGSWGTKYVCSPHSVSFHSPMGKTVGALPSGRLAFISLADGNLSPSQGMDRCGPTAVIKSAGKVDQVPLQGTLFNQKFHPSALKTQEDLSKFIALIKTYMLDMGGKHLQFNIVDRKTLLDAQAHPEKFKNLVVRVAGYSALWVELSRLVQDEIIARSEQNW
jgi:pyruvate formate-lyase/glycerol dehydratase family glycyl radical enzyme